MTVMAVGLAVLAALLAIERPPARRFSRLAPAEDRLSGARPRRWRWWMLAGGAISVIALSLVAAGSGTAVLAAAVMTVVSVAWHTVRSRTRLHRLLRSRVDVADACRVLAAQLRAGRVPADALRSAAETCTVLVQSARVAALGGDPVRVWQAQAKAPGCEGLDSLANGWRLAGRTGAPLATLLERVAAAASADAGVRRMVGAEVSAPRATGKVMAALPICGMAIGYGIGGSPVRFLLSTPPGWVCLLVGTGLAAAGVAWIEGLARSATQRRLI
jgi:tight adherence protein B